VYLLFSPHCLHDRIFNGPFKLPVSRAQLASTVQGISLRAVEAMAPKSSMITMTGYDCQHLSGAKAASPYVD